MIVLEPLGSYMQVRLLEQKNSEQVTAGGIVLTPKAAEAPRVGEVLSVGPGLYNPMGDTPETMYFTPDIEVGDLVYFLQNGPVKIVHLQMFKDEPESYMVAEGDVLGIYMRNEVAAEHGLVEKRPTPVELLSSQLGGM